MRSTSSRCSWRANCKHCWMLLSTWLCPEGQEGLIPSGSSTFLWNFHEINFICSWLASEISLIYKIIILLLIYVAHSFFIPWPLRINQICYDFYFMRIFYFTIFYSYIFTCNYLIWWYYYLIMITVSSMWSVIMYLFTNLAVSVRTVLI